MQSGFPVEEKYMRRAFQLASYGLGSASPNPVVGCVIVYQDSIIGEGFHHQCGQPHAEVNAINAVLQPNAVTRRLMLRSGLSAEQILQGSTLYVTLEPCSHYGKTPPCASLIIRSGIPRVVVSCPDPNPKVDGRGIALLKEAGVQVREHFLEEEGRELGRRYFANVEKRRPYVILKWARTADGCIAAVQGEPCAITGPLLQALNHSYRTQEDAILVGTGTLLSDNPHLNARCFSGRQPVRISLDFHGRVLEYLRSHPSPPHASAPLHFFDGSQPSFLFVDASLESAYAPWKDLVKIVPVEAEILPEDRIPVMLDFLQAEKIGSLIVEGGTALLSSFIRQGCWDEARVFTSPLAFGSGYHAPSLGNAAVVETRASAGEWVHVYKPLPG